MEINHPTIHIDDDNNNKKDIKKNRGPIKVIREDVAIPLPDVHPREEFLKDSVSQKMWNLDEEEEE